MENKTCGNCSHGEIVPSNLKARVCFGGAPSVVLAPTPQGVQLINARPTVNVSDRACGAFKQKIVIEMQPQHPG